ncbi:MAG: HIT family protein [Candidatus Micrarchaeaceae archaeon]
MSTDPFCIEAETGKSLFFESDRFMVLYDIRPVVRGHILFVPKRHMLDILEMTEEEIADFHSIFAKVVPKVLKIYGASEGSYDLTSQIGRYSGRSVEHLHLHMLPRKKDDLYNTSDKSIFEDLKMNKSNFSYEDVKKEVEMLKKEFRYKPK